MKILLLNHFPLTGSGSGVYTKTIAEGLAKNNHEICIIMPENEKIKTDNSKIKIHPVYFKNKEKIEEIRRNEITEEVKKSCTIKSRINRKFEKYRLFRIIKYTIKNPLFFMKRSFYKKLKEKIEKKIKKVISPENE